MSNPYQEDEDDVEYAVPGERTYTALEKQNRDNFVREYQIDYDAYKAAIRIGYPPGYARHMGKKFIEEPYVQRKLKKVEGSMDDPSTDDAKKMILASLWKEANYHGPGSTQAARVAALAKLASLGGHDQPTKNINQLLGADGQPIDGVFVLPGVMTPEAWEAAAKAQQEALTTPTQPVKPTGTVH